MRDIARDADVTVASIYHHFPSKQEVLQEIMVQTLSDVISATRSALMAAGRRPSEQLSALVGAFVLWHTREREVALIGASEIRSLDAVGRRSEEHTSELQSLMRISYAVFCLTQKNKSLKYKPKKS